MKKVAGQALVVLGWAGGLGALVFGVVHTTPAARAATGVDVTANLHWGITVVHAIFNSGVSSLVSDVNSTLESVGSDVQIDVLPETDGLTETVDMTLGHTETVDMTLVCVESVIDDTLCPIDFDCDTGGAEPVYQCYLAGEGQPSNTVVFSDGTAPDVELPTQLGEIVCPVLVDGQESGPLPFEGTHQITLTGCATDVLLPTDTDPVPLFQVAFWGGGSVTVIRDAAGQPTYEALDMDLASMLYVDGTAVGEGAGVASGARASADGEVVENGCPILRVDIKPGSWPNAINLGSKGALPVCLKTAAGCDATLIDPATVTLDDVEGLLVEHGGHPLATGEDCDGDGDLDLVLHFETEGLQVGTGPVEVGASCVDSDGDVFPCRGVDLVEVVP